MQQATKPRTAHLIIGGKIRAAEKRSSIGKKKTGERPAALAGEGTDRGLITGVDIGAFVAVDFDGHEVFVDNLGDLRVFVAFAVDDVAPMAPHGADVEENGFVFRLSASEGGIAPFVPIDRLV